MGPDWVEINHKIKIIKIFLFYDLIIRTKLLGTYL
jgi:hypothetical protein